jgi:hypothetical protein
MKPKNKISIKKNPQIKLISLIEFIL